MFCAVTETGDRVSLDQVVMDIVNEVFQLHIRLQLIIRDLQRLCGRHRTAAVPCDIHVDRRQVGRICPVFKSFLVVLEDRLHKVEDLVLSELPHIVDGVVVVVPRVRTGDSIPLFRHLLSVLRSDSGILFTDMLISRHELPVLLIQEPREPLVSGSFLFRLVPAVQSVVVAPRLDEPGSGKIQFQNRFSLHELPVAAAVVERYGPFLHRTFPRLVDQIVRRIPEHGFRRRPVADPASPRRNLGEVRFIVIVALL